MSEYEHQEIADLTPEQVSRVFNLIGAAIDGLSDVDVAERIAYCETHDARGVRMYRDSDDDVVELRWGGRPLVVIRSDALFSDEPLKGVFVPAVPDTPEDLDQ